MAYTMQPRQHHAAKAVQARREQEAEKTVNEESGDLSQAQQTQQPPQSAAPKTPVQAPQESVVSQSDTSATELSNSRVKALEQELAAYKQQLNEKNAALQELQGREPELPEDVKKELDELRKYRDDLEMQQLLAVDQDFETIDKEAAAELSAKVLRPALEKLEKRYESKLRITQEELNRIQKDRQAREASMSEAQKNTERARVNAAILGAHPDFETILQTEQFAQFSARPAWKGSRVTLGQLMRDEYNNGNADFVIDALNDYKGGKSSLADFASVSVSSAASVPASGNTEPQYTEEDVSLWNQQLATGKITREEYKKLRAEYKAQKVAAGAV